MDQKEFGLYMKSLRMIQGLSMAKLAELSGVSSSYIANIENGKRGIPSPDILKKLAEPLGVEYYHLMTKAGYLVPPLVGPVVTTFEDNDEKTEPGMNEFTKEAYSYDIEHLILNEKLIYRGHILTEEEKTRLLEALPLLFPDKK